MSHYLLIESRDPFETGAGTLYALALGLARAGHGVTLFLVENGVLPARAGARSELTGLAQHGVEVLADQFSLGERGIPPQRLCAGVRIAGLETVLDHMGQGHKTLWH